MSVSERSGERPDVRQTFEELRRRLRPSSQRDWALERLNELFRNGRAPDPPLEGFLKGELITTSIAGPADATVRKIADMWMPWLGKSFDRSSKTGLNVLVRSARTPMNVLWPNYEPVRETDDRIEVFPFRTRIAPGELDPETSVLKIDYDIEANPSFLIRRLLDELVRVDDGLYLGKILMRSQSNWRAIGFFSLEV